jgi:hypothetical protein
VIVDTDSSVSGFGALVKIPIANLSEPYTDGLATDCALAIARAGTEDLVKLDKAGFNLLAIP